MNEALLRIKREDAGRGGTNLDQRDAHIPSKESKTSIFPPRKLACQPSGVAKPPSKGATQDAFLHGLGDRKRDHPASSSRTMPVLAPRTISRESFVAELSDSPLACL